MHRKHNMVKAVSQSLDLKKKVQFKLLEYFESRADHSLAFASVCEALLCHNLQWNPEKSEL